MQSPQEWEALQALTVLEACMKNCGTRFHNEVGKFRFLNELIKIVSPKYLGDKVSEKVKTKVIELLYSWTLALPEEGKIKEAYQMLKRQGIVLLDPQISVDRTLITSPPRPKSTVFEDEEKSKLLEKLLKSKKPEDLKEANKLIKSMVKEDEVRMQKVNRRTKSLEEVTNNVKLLNEMLAHYSKEDSSDADKELMKELYESCEKMRRTLFTLASETEDNDNSIGDILQASDDLLRVINSYKKIAEGHLVNGEVETPKTSKLEEIKQTSETETLIDLVGLDIPRIPSVVPSDPGQSPVIPVLPPPPLGISGQFWNKANGQNENSSCLQDNASVSLSLLDEELLSLGLNDPVPTTLKETTGNAQWNAFQAEPDDLDLIGTAPATSGSPVSSVLQKFSQPINSAPATVFPLSQTLPQKASDESLPFLFKSGTASLLPSGTVTAPLLQYSHDYLMSSSGSPSLELDSLGQKCLKEAKGTTSQEKTTTVCHPGTAIQTCVAPSHLSTPDGIPVHVSLTTASIHSVDATSGPGPGSPLFHSLTPQLSSQQNSPLRGMEISLSGVHVPLESIKPSSVLPMTAYDKKGFRVLLHFAKDCPPGRPDILVIVVSMINTAPLPIKNILLQAAVPKAMKVKLQPPSASELSPFNPILPPSAVTQVMLLANPLKEKVRLRYKLTFTMGEEICTETGEVDQFPPTEQWGNL
ncbi:ADP-ribosylation factor-binding protein GGA3 isoform X2 [Protopterus annectens]|nr:ADP-ribosylation factor-binding protein GGA3 isoform X2 [Protopterus annectens]